MNQPDGGSWKSVTQRPAGQALCNTNTVRATRVIWNLPWTWQVKKIGKSNSWITFIKVIDSCIHIYSAFWLLSPWPPLISPTPIALHLLFPAVPFPSVTSLFQIHGVLPKSTVWPWSQSYLLKPNPAMGTKLQTGAASLPESVSNQ